MRKQLIVPSAVACHRPHEGGAVIAPALRAHVASEMQKEAQIMKEYAAFQANKRQTAAMTDLSGGGAGGGTRT